MSQQVLEPASPAEAEMAAVATSCLIAALDHSRAETVKLKLEFDDGQGECPELLLPPKALRFFANVLRQMSKREPMLLVPPKARTDHARGRGFPQCVTPLCDQRN